MLSCPPLHGLSSDRSPRGRILHSTHPSLDLCVLIRISVCQPCRLQRGSYKMHVTRREVEKNIAVVALILCFSWDLVKEMNSNAFLDLKTSWKVCVAGITVFSSLGPVTLHAPLDVFTNFWWRPVLGRLTTQWWYCIPLSRQLVSPLVCH